MTNTFKNTYLLCTLKNRLLYNQLTSKAGIGKIIAFASVVIICIWAVSDFFAEASTKLFALPFGEQLVLVLFAFTVLFLFFVTFAGDLTSGHTINMGQMSTDFEYLQTLPLGSKSIIFLKLYERILNDYFGILITFASFMGILCRDGFTMTSLALAVVLFFHFSTLIGLGINLLMIFLTRFFKKSTINNLFSIVGYLSAFLTLAPVIAFNNQPQRFLIWFAQFYDRSYSFIDAVMQPFIWVAECLVVKNFTMAYLKFFVFWIFVMFIGTLLYSEAFERNWFSYSNSKRRKLAPKKWFPRFLSGIVSKELTLLKSDLSLLVNALLLPVTIIAFEIYIMKTVFSFKTIPSVLNLIFVAIIYFSMFGPINSIGSEGKAVSLLESLPLSPKTIILHKFVFWLLISELVFIPTTFIAFKLLRFTSIIAFKSTLIVAAFTALSMYLALCLSVIYANYNSKVIFHASTFVAKIICLVFMLVLVPVKFVSTKNAISLSLFLTLLFIMQKKAEIIMTTRFETANFKNKSVKLLDRISIFVFYFAVVISFYQFVDFITPGLNVGHWPWSLALMATLPYSALKSNM